MTASETAAPAPAPAGPPAIEVRGLVKRYGRSTAVDGLDLDVPAGHVFGLIGPNGAGKTTTMRCVATLLRPDAGSVRVFGVDALADPRAARGLVGWMPDFFGLYDGLSCAEYLDFFADAFGLDAATRRARVPDLLELVGLAHRAGSDVAELSRGMQQRLGLARALVHHPRLLVLDEPASGLDPRARIELREVLRELARQGTTVLISSHILAELSEECDSIGILEAGRVLAQGTPDGIMRRAGGTVRVEALLLEGDAAALAATRAIAPFAPLEAAVQQGLLRATVAGDAGTAADVLAALVSAGVRVRGFREVRDGLEQVFLAVTRSVSGVEGGTRG